MKTEAMLVINPPKCAPNSLVKNRHRTVCDISPRDKEIAQRNKIYARSYCANRAAHDVAWAEEMGVF